MGESNKGASPTGAWRMRELAVGRFLVRRGHRLRAALKKRRRQKAVSETRVNADYLEILDGRTLNVLVKMPTVTGPEELSAALSVARGSEEHRFPLDVETQPNGEVWASGLAPLEDGITEISEGLWEIGLTLTGQSATPDTATRRHPLAVPEVRALAGGPTQPFAASKTTGRSYAVENSKGLGMLRVRAARPWAEVTSVRMGFTEVEVVGRLLAVNRLGSGTLPVAVARRNGEGAETVLAEVADGVFRYTLPLDAMAEHAQASDQEQIWDFRIGEQEGHTFVRVGQLLIDAVRPRAILTGGQQLIVSPSGKQLRARYYYTPAGSLAFACSLMRPAHQVPVASAGDPQ
ncbi:hypothetical protein ACOKM3_42370 [Streptomyces sp. BH106]|uniref:hypothetical protein n=1 Tax=Streptomyces sp. BH106 TaxID=3410409 RepID=UPI003CF03981